MIIKNSPSIASSLSLSRQSSHLSFSLQHTVNNKSQNHTPPIFIPTNHLIQTIVLLCVIK